MLRALFYDIPKWIYEHRDTIDEEISKCGSVFARIAKGVWRVLRFLFYDLPKWIYKHTCKKASVRNICKKPSCLRAYRYRAKSSRANGNRANASTATSLPTISAQTTSPLSDSPLPTRPPTARPLTTRSATTRSATIRPPTTRPPTTRSATTRPPTARPPTTSPPAERTARQAGTNYEPTTSFYHYTTKESFDSIKKSGIIKISPPCCLLGAGVYFTQLPPHLSSEELVENNYGKYIITQRNILQSVLKWAHS